MLGSSEIHRVSLFLWKKKNQKTKEKVYLNLVLFPLFYFHTNSVFISLFIFFTHTFLDTKKTLVRNLFLQ